MTLFSWLLSRKEPEPESVRGLFSGCIAWFSPLIAPDLRSEWSVGPTLNMLIRSLRYLCALGVDRLKYLTRLLNWLGRCHHGGQTVARTDATSWTTGTPLPPPETATNRLLTSSLHARTTQ